MRIRRIWNVVLVMVVVLVFVNIHAGATSFLDDFSSDTSSDYTGTAVSWAGSWGVSGGTLNLDPNGSGTYNVFRNIEKLEEGEYVSVDIPATDPRTFYLTVSTTNRNPNISGAHGIRLAVQSGPNFRVRKYVDGAETVNNSYSFSTATNNMTLYIYRDTATEYRLAYDGGNGIRFLGGTITISETSGEAGMYVGVEVYNTDPCHFDNLKIADIPMIPAVGAFLDDFSNGSVGSYIETGGSGSWGTTNDMLYIDPVSEATYYVFLWTAKLAEREHVRVDVPATDPRSFYLTVSTTNRSPLVAGSHGIRLAVQGGPNFRVRKYVNGAESSNVSYPTSDAAENLTLYIYRDTATKYRVGYDAGSGVQFLGGTITINETSGEAGMYVGVEVYDGTPCHFDNLEIVVIPVGTTIIIK